MHDYLAWINPQGFYITASEGFLSLTDRETLANIPLHAIHSACCVEALQHQCMLARQQGESQAYLALFQQHTDYDCKIYWLAPFEHFVLAVNAKKQRVHVQHDHSIPRFKVPLDEQIMHAKQQHKEVALLSLEVLKLEWIAAAYGEAASVQVRDEICLRLSGSLRDGDSLYQVDDETFLVQLNRIDDANAAMAVANRLLEKLFYGIRLERQALHLNVAIGVALAPSQAQSAGELTGAAKQALQAVKRGNQSGVRLYDPIRQRKALNLSDLAQALQPNIEHISFRFRPLYGVHSHKMEAAQIIPLLRDIPCNGKEEAQLDTLLRSERFCQGYLLRLLAFLKGPLEDIAHQKGFNGIIVRLPSAILEHTHFIRDLQAHMHALDALKHLVFFEVDAFEIQEFEGILFDLEALGFRIVINGFSTFMPCLQQIKELEPEMLKLEESLVQQMENDPKMRQLLEKIADIAYDLEIPLTADGVQSGGQRLQLAQQGVVLMQGDYFGGLLTSDLLIEQLILEKL